MANMELSNDEAADSATLHSRYEAEIISLGFSDELTDPAQWQSRRDRLAKRSIDSLVKLLGKPSSQPLLWGLPLAMQSSDTADLLGRLAKAAEGKKRAVAWAAEALPNWLDEAAGREPDMPHAIECLAWCAASRQLAAKLEAPLWFELLGLLIQSQEQAAGVELEKSPLLHQLVSGELSVTLAYMYPDIKSLGQQATKGRRAIAAGITELLDGEGLPVADHTHWLRPLVACWTRSATMCQALRQRLLREETGDGYAWAVQQMVRLTRGDGKQLLDGEEHQLDADFAKAAVKLADDDDCTTAAALTGLLGRKAQAKVSRYDAPAAGTESEWAAAAVLRDNWTAGAVALAMQHSRSDLVAEMSIGSRTLFSGAINPHVEIDGTVHPPKGAWEQTCWYADDDADYLELEIALESGWRVQRQTMLARTDAFLLIADAVLAPENDTERHTIEYRLELPLAAGLAYRPEEETSEGNLIDEAGNSVALALPLALPEWRSGPPRGKLELDEGQRLVLRQKHEGSNLYAPLLLDYYPKRMRKQLTWRQLTIADQLQIQPADAAVGYRVQIGLEQWLIYRSLAQPRNRTVLGHNLTSEFLVARFDDGETEPLVEIE